MLSHSKVMTLLLTQYGHPEIQLHTDVVHDILDSIEQDSSTRMLVFGCGYDSLLWFHATRGKTWFVEDNPEYIRLQENEIPSDHLCFYEYTGITVQNSLDYVQSSSTESFFPFSELPPQIKEHGPYDIILIDGPNGYDDSRPGRLLPIRWCVDNRIAKPGTLVYMDDSSRLLEKQCMEKYLVHPGVYTVVHRFPFRLETTKLQKTGTLESGSSRSG